MNGKNTANQLVALKKGVARYAEPIVCGDLTGPGSLFGNNTIVPKPLGKWIDFVTKEDAGFDNIPWLSDGVVLWREGVEPADASLQVMAPTFLVGVSSSTFDVAWTLQQKGFLPPWAAVIATQQNAGRGQLRRDWHSPRGNLYVSFRLPDDPLFKDKAGAIVAGGLVVSALQTLGFAVWLKWPNDILNAEDAKVAGLLLEERDGAIIAGLGVNMLLSPGEENMRELAACPAGVLYPVAADMAYDALPPFFLWQALSARCAEIYDRFIAGQTLTEALKCIEAYFAWKGRQIQLYEEECVAQGVYLGVGPEGGLLIKNSSGSVRECFSGSMRCI